VPGRSSSGCLPSRPGPLTSRQPQWSLKLERWPWPSVRPVQLDKMGQIGVFVLKFERAARTACPSRVISCQLHGKISCACSPNTITTKITPGGPHRFSRRPMPSLVSRPGFGQLSSSACLLWDATFCSPAIMKYP
jgi:hypothetical protein